MFGVGIRILPNSMVPAAVLRFPRRYPLSLLIVFIPLSLLLYSYCEPGRTQIIIDPVWNPRNVTSPANPEPTALLVTAFYPNLQSSISPELFNRLIERIHTPLYIFTTPEIKPLLYQSGTAAPVYINTSFASPLDVPPLAGAMESYESMSWRGREPGRKKKPEVYALRNSKAYFLESAIQSVTDASPAAKPSYVFWFDPLAVDELSSLFRWPHVSRLEETWSVGENETGTKKEDLLLWPVEAMPHSSLSLWQEGMGPIKVADNQAFSTSTYSFDHHLRNPLHFLLPPANAFVL